MRNYTIQPRTIFVSSSSTDLFNGRTWTILSSMALAMECKVDDVSEGFVTFLVNTEDYDSYHKGLSPSEEECLRDLCRFLHDIAKHPDSNRVYMYVNMNTGSAVSLVHVPEVSLTAGRDPLASTETGEAHDC